MLECVFDIGRCWLLVDELAELQFTQHPVEFVKRHFRHPS